MKDINDLLESPAQEDTKQPSIDTCYTLDANGQPSNSQLHDDIMAGVPSRRGEKYAKKWLNAHGLTDAVKILT